MSRFLIIILLLIAYISPSYAEEASHKGFYVEGERAAASAIPEDIQTIIRSEQKAVEAGHFKNVTFVGEKINLSDEPTQSDYIVTPSTWDSANAPIWIIQKTGEKNKLIFEYSAGGISVEKTMHSGMRDIAILGGSAADAHETIWIFNGDHYAAQPVN